MSEHLMQQGEIKNLHSSSPPILDAAVETSSGDGNGDGSTASQNRVGRTALRNGEG